MLNMLISPPSPTSPVTIVHMEMFEVATGRHKTAKRMIDIYIYEYVMSQTIRCFEKSESFVVTVIKFMYMQTVVK